jgi:hypothetical protein
MSKLRDKLWIWGQNVGCHHKVYGELPGENKMDTKEGCDFLGINKCCRVAMLTGPFPPFDNEAEKLKDLDEVVWSAVGAGGLSQHNDDKSDLDEVIRMAEIYPNITGAVLDDFFSSVEFSEQKSARHSVESIRQMKSKLNNFEKRKLDLWLVWYSYQLDYDVQEYVDLCDVMTLWVWKGSELDGLETYLDKVKVRSPEKRHFAGCYMWNYGERKELPVDMMKFQLDKYYEWLKSGKIEGIILCSNCIADTDLPAVQYTKEWIVAVGDENI